MDIGATLAAPAERVFAAFFDAEALARWWHVDRAIVAPRLFAPYALSWPTSAERDPLLGPLGGLFHGTVMDVRPPREAFIAECYWVPPEGDAIGPMALSISCIPAGGHTRLRVQQTGFEDAPRWRRYYELVEVGLRARIDDLGRLLEAGAL